MKSFFLLLATIVGVLAVGTGLIHFFQHRLIYFPRGYSSLPDGNSGITSLTYETSAGKQTVFLLGETEPGSGPQEVWWFFNGNGSRALEWVDLLNDLDLPPGHCWVLFEYPGYGLSEGKPGPDAIFASIARLHETLAQRWNLSPEDLSQRSRLIGHSLGAAAALKTAAHFHIPQVVAISPFTSMQEMARKQVGWLEFALSHHYDNRESVKNWMKTTPQAHLIVFHGSNDWIIPPAMGQELAVLAGAERSAFHLVTGAGHSDIVYLVRRQLFK